MIADSDDYDYPEWDDCMCPRCNGFGSIDCHCGGDLCVCTNYGDAECPLCQGEGNVSDATYTAYEDRQRVQWAAYQAAVTRRSLKPPKASKPKPPTTPKRAKIKAARKQRNQHG